MDGYAIFKFLHVAFAIAWLGGGLALIVLAVRAQRAGDAAERIRVIRDMIFLSPRLFIPAAFGALIAGVVMVFIARSWDEPWVMLGLAGFAATFITGTFVLKPRGERFLELAKAGDTAAATAVGRELLAIAKFDFTLLFVIVADMVLKPMWGDTVVIGAMAAVIILAAVAFLRPALRPARV